MNTNFMKSCRWMLLLPAMLCMAGFASADQETDRLRAENTALRTENAALKAQMDALREKYGLPPAAVAVPGASAAVANPPNPVPALVVPVQVPATSVPSAATAAQPLVAAPAAPPAGYKLVPVNTPEAVDPLAPPYDKTGCSLGLFRGPPPGKWNNADSWFNMGRGLSMSEVESMLGKEHFDASGQGRVEWQYGKCGDSVGGRVVFKDGKVVLWQAPST